MCTRGQRARTKDEHERGGGKGKRESAEDAFRCATRGIKDGRDFGNAGLYAANNQCILVCCLGLHGRLHRDKCNAANLLTSLPTYRVSEKLMEPTSFDRDRSRSSPADKRIILFSLRFPLDFNFSRSYRDFCSIVYYTFYNSLKTSFLPFFLFRRQFYFFLLYSNPAFSFFWRGGGEEEEEKHALFRSVNNGIASFHGERKRPFFLGRFSGDEIRLFGVSRHNRGREEEKEKKGAIVRNGLEDI